MKKIKTVTQEEQQHTEGLQISNVLTQHLGKVMGCNNALFVLSDKDLIREKTPPFQDVVIPAVTSIQLEYLYNNGLKFLFEPNIKTVNGNDTGNEYGHDVESDTV